MTDDNYSQQLTKRLQTLQGAAHSAELQGLLLTQCRRDIMFWFNHFCWTFDPRLSQPHRPFQLYDYQVQALRDIVNAIEEGHDLLIEKSRDMGISWLVLLVFQYYWLFREGSNFHLGSRKEESVDRKGDISTLLEKIRYNLEWMPSWMRPEGFQSRQHDNALRLLNPANGNVITGESSNENFGRGGRYKAMLLDEFPFWPHQNAAYASAGQSAPCRLVVGTPYGKNNRFAELRFSGLVKVLRIHWHNHPTKNTEWYEEQKTRMSEDELARELDINYNLSLKNRVFRNFTEANKGDLETLVGVRVVRSWDFGYHRPACVFLQIDRDGRVLVLMEIVGEQDLLIDFANRVLDASKATFPEAQFEDVCDPAGAQRSDKSTHTCIEILNSLGVYPYFDRTGIRDGIELIRMKLSERRQEQPGLVVDNRCEHLIAAFEGGYRFGPSNGELPLQEHPYEDVMDCLRYAVMAKCGILSRNPRKAKQYKPQNRYTGY